ncbi:nitrogenase-stabilizing/protective protein NifW [Sulfurivermis fontis]|uniref:nitrogenase-stabilizing/protective protein NifW n=1 Tax=Sulfurivermis fontis TaxID=1972068 RepID=UPI000FD9EA36|nr:nitrogenase-stabilizing/protective protein NifW [Sulfurivermis fontis]
MSTLNDDLQDLESTEDFLDYFGIGYERAVVQVYRLHILQRFHDYMQRVSLPEDEDAQRAAYREALAAAYQDFVLSDAVTEKVFKVFQAAAPRKVPVTFTDIRSF